MYQFLLNFHSGFRYLALILILTALLRAITSSFSKTPYQESTRKINLVGMIAAHLQLLSGIILYFWSPFVNLNALTMKNPTFRYWSVEHVVLMVFAVTLITIGYSRSKKMTTAANPHRTIIIFYGLALLVIILAIAQSGRGIV